MELLVFNTPLTSDRCKIWASIAYWRFKETIMLSIGLDPDIEDKTISHEQAKKNGYEFMSRFEMISRNARIGLYDFPYHEVPAYEDECGYEEGDLEEVYKPAEFAKWAVNNFPSFPEELLKAIMERNPNSFDVFNSEGNNEEHKTNVSLVFNTDINKDEKGSFLFKKEGFKWYLAFGGEPIIIQLNKPTLYKGLDYIALLIKRCPDSISVFDLSASVEKNPSRSMSVFKDSMPMMDEKALNQTKAKIRELDGLIVEAKKNNHTEWGNSLLQQRNDLAEHLKKAQGKFGKARPIGDIQERVRKAVSKAIDDAINVIIREETQNLQVKVEVSLSMHLKNSIKKGLSCRYTPEKKINWEF